MKFGSRVQEFAIRAVLIPMVALSVASVARAGDAPVVSGDVGRQLDDYLTRLSMLGFSGSAIVARDDGVLLQKGYGLADREGNRPVTTDTIFTIGSITKQFTGAAILKLEMMGKLSVNDPITKYFDNVPADKRSMTIHHLLSHTAGLPGALGDDFGGQGTREWLAKKAMSSELAWKPGTRYQYSNVGFSLAAMIVEKVSGLGYEQFLLKYLFKPAGMIRTGYVLPRYSDSELAVGYRDDTRWGTFNERPMLEDGPNWNLRGNGGIHSTPGEMYKWHRALLGETILSKEAKEKYFAKHADEGGGSFYGYGWSVTTTPWGTKSIQHNGGNTVFSADCRRYVEDRLFVYICTNLSTFGPPDPISEQLARIALGKPHTMPPKALQLGSDELKAFVGTYRFENGGEIRVAAGRVGLVLSGANQAGSDLIAGRLDRDDPKVGDLLTKTDRIIRDWMQGDYDSLLAHWGGQMTSDRVREALQDVRRRRTQRLGPFEGISNLSIKPDGDMTIVTACVRHAKQEAAIDIGWRDGKCIMIGLDDECGSESRPLQVYALGSGRFESFSLTSPRRTRVEFTMRNGSAHAAKLGLLVGGRKLEAKRVY